MIGRVIRLTPSQLASASVVRDLELDAAGRPACPLVAVELDGTAERSTLRAAARAADRLDVALVGIARGALGAEWQDLVAALTTTVTDGTAPHTMIQVPDLDEAVAALDVAVNRHPHAALTLAGVLRATARLPVREGLALESAAYSMLLAGPEFAAWRATRPSSPPPAPTGQAVLLARDGATLTVTLNRPDRHNAFAVDVRDGLVEALDLALSDRSIEQVTIGGAGPSFCSGGDLDEFGTTPDVATAHLIRLDRSVAARVHRLRDRVTVVTHGACIGAGVEIPSFAGRVLAREGTYFQLPEGAMGLIPGAGGTVGITRRVGRWRTAYLALTGVRLTLDEALDWGLVDERAT